MIRQTILYEKCHTSSVSWGIMVFNRVSLQTETKIHQVQSNNNQVVGSQPNRCLK